MKFKAVLVCFILLISMLTAFPIRPLKAEAQNPSPPQTNFSTVWQEFNYIEPKLYDYPDAYVYVTSSSRNNRVLHSYCCGNFGVRLHLRRIPVETYIQTRQEKMEEKEGILELKPNRNNSLQSVVEVKEATMEEANRLLPLGWRLLYITTVSEKAYNSHEKKIVYVLGRMKNG